jgi:hypothetical protein
VYFACHGEEGKLIPGDGRSKISLEDVNAKLEKTKPNAIGFIHFGCCAYLRTDPTTRRKTLEGILAATGADWASGYTRDVDWLSSTLLDIALISDIYVPWRKTPTKKAAHRQRLDEFSGRYEQLARSLGLSAISAISGENELFPKTIRGAI